VTRLTVDEAIVADVDLLPVASVVAGSARLGVVIGGHLIAVTLRTIRQPGVIKIYPAPVAGVVTVGALSGIVVWLAVTAAAVAQADVAEVNVLPVIGAMTVGALALVVVRFTMTATAVGQAGVAEIYVLPVARGMAVAAGALEVRIGFVLDVACGARGVGRRVGVIEGDLGPRSGVVTE
jgi:hypothetical protein